MYKLIVTLLFAPLFLYGQVSENFESGTIRGWTESIAGRWKADSSGVISGKYSLHHIYDNADAGTDQIGLQTTGLKPSSGPTRWSFRLRHGYDPSSSNNWGVFLCSDSPPASMVPGGNVNGYILGVNITGYDDTLRLWKIRNGTLSVALTTHINWQNNIGLSNPALLVTERTISGRWKVLVYSKNNVLADSTSALSSELFNCDWFGIYYKYTSTRDRLLWVDDITVDGSFFEDKEPPEINSCSNYSLNSVDIFLNEEPTPAFFQETNFALKERSQIATGVSRLSQSSVRVTFKEQLKNKTGNKIFIKSMCDRYGNCNTDKEINFIPAWVEQGDVIISEIMADPAPAVSLPEREYLEIFNRTAFSYNLKKWKLSNDGSGSVFPDKTLNPYEQMILCQLQDTSYFLNFGKVCGLKSFPSLTDAGRVLILFDSLGLMIHGLEYSSEWNNEPLKKNGGWSLEMVDTDFPFYYNGNWRVSVSTTGGTPGKGNSVSHLNRDKYFGGILNAFPTDSLSLKISFTEPVLDLAEYMSGITINQKEIRKIIPDDPLFRSFIILSAEPFQRNIINTVEINQDVRDFAGNKGAMKSIRFGIPEMAAGGDIVFNELMFNPLPGDPDYIELYNKSEKIINAADLLLASVDDDGKYSETFRVSTESRCITPGSYYTVTTNKEAVISRYQTSKEENIFEVQSMPSMPDDKGHLILFNRKLNMIDEVIYSEKMHYPLFSGNEGISLEKVRAIAPSNDPKNWYSASQASGWGTPGRPNSVAVTIPESGKKIVLSSTRITPDNDGFEDFLVIEYTPETKGNVISVTVFDEAGRLVSKVASNILSGPRTSIVWNGSGQDGNLVESGIYILLITAFDENGRRESWKKVCTVIR
jgi:hypothetical protein